MDQKCLDDSGSILEEIGKIRGTLISGTYSSSGALTSFPKSWSDQTMCQTMNFWTFCHESLMMRNWLTIVNWNFWMRITQVHPPRDKQPQPQPLLEIKRRRNREIFISGFWLWTHYSYRYNVPMQFSAGLPQFWHLWHLTFDTYLHVTPPSQWTKNDQRSTMKILLKI